MPLIMKVLIAPLSYSVLAITNLYAWISTDWGLISTAITAVALAIIAVSERAINVIGAAWIQFKAKRDEAFKASYLGQLDEVNKSLHAARESLHILRNEAQNQAVRHALELTRHTEEVARLNDQLGLAVDQLKATNEELRLTRIENARLVAIVGKVDHRVDVVNSKVEEVKATVGENKEAIEDLSASHLTLPIVPPPKKP